MFKKMVKEFNMMWFIMALGLGGTSVAGFSFLNYTVKRTPDVQGLIHFDVLSKLIPSMPAAYQIFYGYLRYHIAIFAILHLVAMVFIGILFVLWRINYPEKYRAIADDPTRSAVTIAPALALGMTFNVFLTSGFIHFAWVRTNMQQLMFYGLIFWGLIWLYTMWQAVQIQGNTLTKGFEVSKMHFGWLLVPFALAMTAVSGAGIAALAKDPTIATTAFFFSFIPFSMALFLVAIKLFSLFIAHYNTGLPEKVEYLPAFFIIIPITTLLAITMFRYGHYFERHTDSHLSPAYFAIVTAGPWAFMFWYFALGGLLLRDYWKNHLFNMKYFDESQWGLICPLVAFAVLGSFVYNTMLPNPLVLTLIAAFMIFDVIVMATMIIRQYLKLRGNISDTSTTPRVGHLHA